MVMGSSPIGPRLDVEEREKNLWRSWWNGRHGGLKHRYLIVCRFKSGGAYEKKEEENGTTTK